MANGALPPIVPTVHLPTVDGDSAALRALDAACREHGFFLLSGHGIEGDIDAMWRASRAFFASGRACKAGVARTPDRALGYYDRELTKRQRDLKEVFDFTEPRAERDPNRWPDGPEGFRDAMAAFYAAAGALAQRTLQLVYRALAVDDAAELPLGSLRTSNVRLNYYPVTDPVPAAERAAVTATGSMALHHHTDPGLLTLLLQDETGGLQTQLRDGSWIDVPPVDGTVVVNLGDALQVLSNDRYRAAVHRVLPRGIEARYSTPFFLNPAPATELAPLAHAAGEPARYRPFLWREYIQHRIDDNFSDLGAEDTQISHYRTAAPAREGSLPS